MRLLNDCLAFKAGEKVKIKFENSSGKTGLLSLYNDAGFIGIYRPEENAECCYDLGEPPRGLYFFDILLDGERLFSEQFIVYNRLYAPPDFLRRGIIYQVFVDRFCKGEGKVQYGEKAVLRRDWYTGVPEYAEKPGGFIENNDFFGGNLWGVAQQLDYISSLGAVAVYISPVFEAASNHKYDTGDYMKIDGGYGGEEAFENLLAEAKKRDIAVIIDGVFNHTGSDSRYFNADGGYNSVGAAQSKESPYYGWYTFKSWPDDYDCWWGVKTLPAIKDGCADFEDFISGEGGVLDKWLKKGVNGVRLDVADELSDGFIKKIARRVKGCGGYLLGEVWEDASNKVAYGRRREYFLGSQLDGVMNYPLREGIIDFLVWKNSVKLKQIYKSLTLHYPPECAEFSSGFLGSHDTERIMTVLGGEYTGEHTNAELAALHMTGKQREYGVQMVRAAYLLLVMLCGTPCLYYGDEIGMEGYRDPFNRRPYPWGKGDKALLEWFRLLGTLKKSGGLDGRCELLDSDEKTLYCRRGAFTALVNMSDSVKTFYFQGKARSVPENKEYIAAADAAPGSCLLLKNTD